MADDTQSERFQEFASSWYKRLVGGVSSAYGKPVDAAPMSADETLALWLKPTSPPAQIVYERGGTDEEATRVNELWAHAMKGEQIKQRGMLQQQGMAEPQIVQTLGQQGLNDDQITETCRKYAVEIARKTAGDDPKAQVAFHKRQAERAAQRMAPQVTYETQEAG